MLWGARATLIAQVGSPFASASFANRMLQTPAIPHESAGKSSIRRIDESTTSGGCSGRLMGDCGCFHASLIARFRSYSSLALAWSAFTCVERKPLLKLGVERLISRVF